MSYSWGDIKGAIEREENTRLAKELEEREIRDGHAPRSILPVQRTRQFLEVGGGIVVGLYAALMTIIIDFLVFNWILHVRFGL